MKKTLLLLFGAMALNMFASETIIILTNHKKTHDEEGLEREPKVSYDDVRNSLEVSIEAESLLMMRVIDYTGAVVYSCPVMMVDGTPTNYVLPQLPAGIYTLKVESDDVSYEGTLVIE